MKQINLTSVRVREVILRPQEETPLSVLFEVLDEKGVVVMHKNVVVKKEDMPVQAGTALDTLVTRITNRLTQLEGI